MDSRKGNLTLKILVLGCLAGTGCGLRVFGSHFGHAPLLERYSWNVMDWNYPDESSRQEAIAKGEYIPENALPVGIEIWKKKLFVTVPRWKDAMKMTSVAMADSVPPNSVALNLVAGPFFARLLPVHQTRFSFFNQVIIKPGVPGTLNYISLDTNRGGSPKLTPYPNWAQNSAGDCGSGLTTVYRIHADVCDRLWVLDVGTIGYGNETKQVCPYTLNVFDLNRDKIIRKYRLRADDINANTFIANIAVDIGKGGCDDAYAYMSDELGYGLIVYSWSENKSWRVMHGYFMPDPLAGDYNIGGLNFQWSDEGVFGMSLSPISIDGYRTLFFHPLSSNREFAVSTKILRDEQLALDSFHEFQVLDEISPLAHRTAAVMNEHGLQFYNLVDHNAVGCWNSILPFTPANHAIVAKHDDALIFPCDVKISRGVLWIMSDRMPVFLISTLNYTDVNFRILTVPVQEAIAGTVCDNSPYFYTGNHLYWNRR